MAGRPAPSPHSWLSTRAEASVPSTGMSNAAGLKYRAMLAAAWRRGMSGLCAGNGRRRHIQVRQQQGLGRLLWSAAPSPHVQLIVGQLGGARI